MRADVDQARPRQASFSERWLGMMLGVTLVGCASMDPAGSGSERPPAPQPEVIVTRLTAAISGELVLVEGCLQIATPDGDWPLVAPPDAEVLVDGETVTITIGLVAGDRQTTVIRLGDTVFLGGGERYTLDRELLDQVPRTCSPPYWILGDGVRLEATRAP